MNPRPLLLRSLSRLSTRSVPRSSISVLPPLLSSPISVLAPSSASTSFHSASFQGASFNSASFHSASFHGASFNSAYCIDKIYPGSNSNDVADLVHGEFAKRYSVEVREKFTGFIPPEALQIRYMRSSGPGGQSVNTSNTKVEVRFNLDEADWIPLWIKKQFAEDHKHRINKKNEFVITSEKTRTQLLNQADCLDRIRHFVREAEIKATPKEIDPEEEARIASRKAKANERRLVEKKRRSMKNSMRGQL